jgi:hypothetical protein
LLAPNAILVAVGVIEKIIIPIKPKIKPLLSLLKPEKKFFIKFVN